MGKTRLDTGLHDRRKGGRKVGIIGVIGYGLKAHFRRQGRGLPVYDPIPIVRNLAAKLRSEEKCDLVIVARHDYSQYFYLQVAAFSEASQDAIVCGHTHQYIEEEELREDDYVIPIIQSDDKTSRSARSSSLRADGKLQSASMRHYDPMLYKADEAVAAVIAEYEDDIEAGERVIAYTVENLSRSRLGEEMTRAMKEKYGVDVAIINTGRRPREHRARLIRVKDVYEVFPFDNRIILTGINGRQLNNLTMSKDHTCIFFVFRVLHDRRIRDLSGGDRRLRLLSKLYRLFYRFHAGVDG